jgi:hypothetical protein
MKSAPSGPTHIITAWTCSPMSILCQYEKSIEIYQHNICPIRNCFVPRDRWLTMQIHICLHVGKCFSHIDFQLLLKGCMILSDALNTADHYHTLSVHTRNLHSYFRITFYFKVSYFSILYMNIALFLLFELLVRIQKWCTITMQ